MDLWLQIPRWTDLTDILLVTGMVWIVISTIRRTRARAALGGLALVTAIYVFARGVGLPLTTMLLQGFFAVVVLVLVVLFQEDLRRAFEQLGSWRIGGRAPAPETDAMDVLVRSVARLASTRTGALIVLPQTEAITRHVEGGVELGGRVSEPILLSIFDASSPGHDGAIVVREGKIERFAAHLPLSSNHAAVGPGGTRHAAALGLAERCDAICIVVSEERGTISVARDGQLTKLNGPEALAAELQPHEAASDSATTVPRARTVGEIALAFGVAFVMWLAFVPGSETGLVRVDAEIELSNLPADIVLESVTPTRVGVSLRGLRRDLVLLDPDDVTVTVDAYLAKFGRRTFAVETTDVGAPAGVSVEGIEPTTIRISAAKTESESEAP